MPEQNAVVAVYATHVNAEAAVKELQRAGVDMHTLSIVGRCFGQRPHIAGSGRAQSGRCRKVTSPVHRSIHGWGASYIKSD